MGAAKSAKKGRAIDYMGKTGMVSKGVTPPKPGGFAPERGAPKPGIFAPERGAPKPGMFIPQITAPKKGGGKSPVEKMAERLEREGKSLLPREERSKQKIDDALDKKLIEEGIKDPSPEHSIMIENLKLADIDLNKALENGSINAAELNNLLNTVAEHEKWKDKNRLDAAGDHIAESIAGFVRGRVLANSGGFGESRTRSADVGRYVLEQRQGGRLEAQEKEGRGRRRLEDDKRDIAHLNLGSEEAAHGLERAVERMMDGTGPSTMKLKKLRKSE